MALSRRAVVTGIASALGGCSPAAVLNSTVMSWGYTREANLAYGRLTRQKLDVYRPNEPRADGKSVIFFYGGSWDSGSRS
jgi:acetyl esterase/lipase